MKKTTLNSEKSISLGFSSCDVSDALQRNWNTEVVEHEGFTDLGNYIIKLPDFKDSSIEKEGLELMNQAIDYGDITKIGCSAMAKKNSKGEVVIGRNMDLFISQKPAYVFSTTFGKYKNFCITYHHSTGLDYKELQKQENLDKDFLAKLLYKSTDCINEKGLYVETDMRTGYPGLSNYGLHSAHGETKRDDGTPWKELRACTMAIPQLVSQNCATVEETLEFLGNSYDWYTTGMPYDPTFDGYNYCFIIGDATGEFGLIEMAQDEISYIPYQYGQANFYITPKWTKFDVRGTGYGRLDQISKVITGVDSLDDAMKAMESVFWKNTTLWVGESKRVNDKTHPNPFNQVVFQDDEGNRQLDWRSEYEGGYPVLDDGRLVLSTEKYDIAVKSTYDTDILKYIDEAVEKGQLVVDDGSIKIDVEGKKCTLAELEEKYNLYFENWDNPKEQEKLKPYYEALNHLIDNMNARWFLDDHNFEAMKAAIYAELHIRYDAEGNYNPSCMSKYEKLLAFYGKGTKKDENPLRDDASVWTSSLNVGVNCSEKKMKVRFWENSGLILTYQFD